MGEPGSNQLDRRLLKAGYLTAAIGYGMLLIGALLPGLAWVAAHERVNTVMAIAWMFSFALLGVAMINSGKRLRHAYRAGMQSGF